MGGRAAGWLLVAAVAAGGVLSAWTPGAGRPGWEVVAVATDGARTPAAALPLPADGRFGVAYRHSVYRAPALERFVRGPDARFRMVGVSSPQEAVLDYYAVEGARTRRAGWWHLELSDPVDFDRLPLIATTTGQRTLVSGEGRAPLFRSDGPRHLDLLVRPSR